MKSLSILLAVTWSCGVLSQAPANPADSVETITVYAHPLGRGGGNLAQPTQVLAGEALSRKLGATVGETLANEPGITTTFFGPGVGRPVIHGLSQARVRVMEDQIDALDVSVSSGDHAVSVEPFIADRVEILKGPSALIYGSGAVGGAVNVVTGRIPIEVPDAHLGGRFEARGASVNDETTAAGRLDGGAGVFAWHADGFYRESSDYEIPGYAESDALREQEAQVDPTSEEARGKVPNSDVDDTRGGAVGASWVGDAGFVGASVSRYESNYGLPGGHDEPSDEDLETSGARIDLEQTRYDLSAGWSPMGRIEQVDLRFAYNDYQHDEIEGSGAVGTAFDSDAWEALVHAHHARVAGWDGIFGVQFVNREFSATGEEAFVEPVDSQAVSIFVLEKRSMGPGQFETGARLEWLEHDPATRSSEDFTSVSGSVGYVWLVSEDLTLSFQGDVAARAPTPEELYSAGPHLATASFEIGDPNLSEERSLTGSLTATWDVDRWLLAGTVYATRFSDYIFQRTTGADVDGLPVRQWSQGDSEFLGFEGEISYALIQQGESELTLRTFFDTVQGQLDDAVGGTDDLPMIPPSRFGVGLAGSTGPFTATLDYTYVDDQNDVAAFELPTEGYHGLNAYLSADLNRAGTLVTVYVKGINLTDDEQRLHTSLIKDLAPLPGRSVVAGVRLTW